MKNKSKYFLSIYFVVASFMHLHAQSWDWVQTIQPGGNEYVWDITNDKQGNVFATGRVKAYSTFGSGTNIQSPPPISVNETDMFIAKYRPNGDLVWAKRDGSKQPDWGRAVACDGQGNVYVTGDYCDTATFGAHQVIAKGSTLNRNIFFAKYDSSGTCLWVKSAGNAAGYSKGYGVAVDSMGNSYITGYITGIVTFDAISVGTTSGINCFVAKFDPNGNCLWATRTGSSYGSEGQDISIDKNGDLLITGDYAGALYVNVTTYPGNSPSYPDVFLAKMNTSGTFIWATTAIGAFMDMGNTVTSDINGNIYIAGTFANDLTFGTTTINSLGWGTNSTTASAGIDAFVAKYTSNGIFQWVKAIGNTDDLTLDEMAITPSNKLVVSGFVRGPNVNMAGTLLNLDTTVVSYITTFDTAGNVLWYKLDSKRNAEAVARGVCIDKYGNYFLGGELFGDPTYNFDSIVVQSYNGFDGYIAKLYPPLNPVLTSDYAIICPGQNVNFSAFQEGYPLTYQWDFPGGAPSTSALQNPVINYSGAGTYTATLIISNGHQADTATIDIQVTPGACVSVPEYANNINISIAPNPVASMAIIHLNGIDLSKSTTLQLYNYLGQEIGMPFPVTENAFVLNAETIPPGGYFITIIQDQAAIKTEKLLIINH